MYFSCESNNQRQNEIYGNWKKLTYLEMNTVNYIENFLKPNWNWTREIAAKQRIELLRSANVNWAAISDHIKGMEYRDFLTTPYWKAIAAHVKYRAGYRCQLCNCPYNLTAHHRNYEIHGREHDHMNELIALCNRCHQKFHGNEEKKIQAASENSHFIFRAIVSGLVLLMVVYLLTWAIL